MTTTELKYLPKDIDATKDVLKSLEEKQLFKVLDKFQALIENINTQFGYKDFCTKSRLHTNYLTMLFNDLTMIYNIQHLAIKTIEVKFSDFNSKKRADAFKCYEKFLEFNKEFKVVSKTFPMLINKEYPAQKLYKENPDTTLRLKKLMKGNKTKAANNDENCEFWDEENKDQNLSEEYNFDQL